MKERFRHIGQQIVRSDWWNIGFIGESQKIIMEKNNSLLNKVWQVGWRAAVVYGVARGTASCDVSKPVLPSSNNNNTQSEFNPTATTEVAKITTGELRIVKDVETKDKLISSLPVNKPEAQGDLDVFTIKVGDKDVPVIMYPILADTYVKSISPTGTENNTLQSVALYTEFVDVDGNKSWVRLTAVNPDPKVQATVWMYDPKGLPGPNETVDMSRAVLGYAFDETQNKAVGIKFQPLFIQPDYIEGYDYKDPVDVLIVGEIPAGMKVQARLVEPESPTASFERMEAEYIETLSPEQRALYEQYGSKDRTSEGLVRQFLTHPDLSTYLAYVDAKPDSKDLGEVVAVWNPEQKKSNPALLIGDDVLILNGTSGDNIKFTSEESEATLTKYFDYVRANIIALSKGVNLPNTLDEALADPQAIEFLDKGAQVNLRAIKSESYEKHKYNVPAQTVSVSGSTAIIFKTVPETNQDMFFISYNQEKYTGWSVGQNENGALTINYFSNGADSMPGGSPSEMLLASRIYRAFNKMFFRASNNDTADTITNVVIFNDIDWSTKPLISYTK